MRRSLRSRRCSSRHWKTGSPGSLVAPMAIAISVGTTDGSVTAARSTNHTPSTNAGSSRYPTSRARRVFPLPPVGEDVLNQLLRGSRQQDLPPVSGVPDPGRAMNVEADVSVADPGALTRVQPDPDPDIGAARPGMAGQLPLDVDGCPDGRSRGSEHGEERVALGIDDLAPLPRQRLAKDVAVLREERGVPVSQLPQEQRGTLDIGEQERDRSGRQLRGFRHAQHL